ncbi:MAG: sensor histidine kinase [Acetatifactor sp.]
MKYSIRRQFALIFIGLMTGTILLCWFINNVFLEEYYIRNKTRIIKDAYSFICQAANSDSYGTTEFAKELNDICSVSNIAVCVMDSNSQTKYESSNGGRELEAQLIGYIFGMQQGAGREIEKGEDYILQVIPFRNTEYLMMFGQLSTGISFILRTPLESIRESVAVANRFLAYVGAAAALGGGIIIWFVSGRITKPIQTLSNISEKMVQLNFEAKYEGKSKNEIGMLGDNINKLSESLEKSISELKTANNQLKTDIKRKEEIDEMRIEFLANVSHELKTPIALIQGYAEGLAEGINDDPESRNFYCEVIIDEASKMNLMVQKLLTLNQLEFGNNVVNMERFDITTLISNYIQSAGILTEKNDIEVCMEDYPSVFVWGDEFEVEEVFMNYFTNAVNHCTGEKKIIVRIEEKDSKIRVSVFNTGEPVPEEALPHLWEKFYKVDKARTREYGGSGVGLSIVKAIMESMNQKYGVENYQNGVLFWFELEQA